MVTKTRVDQKRLAIVRQTRRVVVKVGSSILLESVRGLAREIRSLQIRGISVILVSSGAIASGMRFLGFSKKPRNMPRLQACAALGQPILMQRYQKAFRRHRLKDAQLLLTREDLEDPARFLNAKHTLAELMRLKVVPIINENDTVAVDEIRVGDNDNLAAMVTHLAAAELLILLTDQDGFHTADPTKDAGATPIRIVNRLDRKTLARASGTRKSISIGGMRTKLEAAILAAKFGARTLIANGRDPKILSRIFAGEEVGTLFLLPTRRKWR